MSRFAEPFQDLSNHFRFEAASATCMGPEVTKRCTYSLHLLPPARSGRHSRLRATIRVSPASPSRLRASVSARPFPISTYPRRGLISVTSPSGGFRSGKTNNEDGMSKLRRRVQKLETRLTDIRGLVPHSAEWFSYWEAKVDQVIAGEDSVDLRGMTLEFVDALIAKGKEAANNVKAVLRRSSGGSIAPGLDVDLTVVTEPMQPDHTPADLHVRTLRATANRGVPDLHIRPSERNVWPLSRVNTPPHTRSG